MLELELRDSERIVKILDKHMFLEKNYEEG